MICFDHDDRLVVIDDEMTKAFVWSTEGKEWVGTGEDFPRKVWLEGERLAATAAKNRFPDAGWDALPDVE